MADKILLNIDPSLAVLPKFERLMTDSVGSESIYIRAKETIENIFQDYDDNDKILNIIPKFIELMDVSMGTDSAYEKTKDSLEALLQQGTPNPDDYDLVGKFKELMVAATAESSLYDHARDTLEALFKDYSITNTDKAQVVANVVGSMATNITSAAMGTAQAWVESNRNRDKDKTLSLANALTSLTGNITSTAMNISLEWENQEKVRRDHKAETTATIIGNLAGSMTGSALSAATQWAVSEKDTELKVTEMEYNIVAVIKDGEFKAAQGEKMRWDSIASQAETIRVMGTPVTVDGVVQSLANEGKVWQDIKVAEQQEVNLTKEGVLLDSRLNESFAAIHKAVAEAVINFGSWNYELTSSGLTNIPVRIDAATMSLSDYQGVIAQEQAKGYAYNAWANAVTAQAGMIGTAIASEGAIPDVAVLTTLFKDTVTMLKEVPAAEF